MNFFYQYLKTDQNLPNKNVQRNKSSGKRLPDSYNIYKSQSACQNNFGGRSPDKRNSHNYSQNRYSRSNSQISKQINKIKFKLM